MTDFNDQINSFRDWRNNSDVPAALKDIEDPLDVLKHLKEQGNIGRVLVIHGIPRSTSTVTMKSLASSPSISRELPLFHEVFNNQNDHVQQGDDVLIGKLIDSGILEKRGLDLVVKIMAQEYSGERLEKLLGIVDAVITTIRNPTRHLGCMSSAISQALQHDEVTNFFEIVSDATLQSWQALNKNVQQIQKSGVTSFIIDGDDLAMYPEYMVPGLCRLLTQEGFELKFGQDMMDRWRVDIFDPSRDPWSKEERASTGFNRKNYTTPPIRPEYEVAHNQCQEIYKGMKHMITSITDPLKPKVCVVGGDSGVVGMATRDLLLNQGFDVVTYDLPETPEKVEARSKRRENYETLKNMSELLDYRQAEWLKKQLPASNNTGSRIEAKSIKDAVIGGAEIIVITTGKPRELGQDRSALLLNNAKLFEGYGTEVAQAYLQNPTNPFPKIVVVGNPVDQMTEVTYKQAEFVLKEALKTETDDGKRQAITKTLEKLPNLILGQGGILDGARAAFAIKEVFGVEATTVPVLGTHNDKMVIDFANVFPAISPTEEKKRVIHTMTAGGGSAVTNNIKAATEVHDENGNIIKEGIKQTAFLATAAATAILVEALASEKTTQLPVSHYGKVSGATLGRMCEVSQDGAVVSKWTADIDGGRKAYSDARTAMKDLADAKAMASSVKIEK